MTTVTDAVAKRDNSPVGLIRAYSTDFASVLPSHIKPETWVRLAQGAMKKGRKADNGQFELEVAAANNPGVFLAALLDAARLGLEPGTEQYYLVPRWNKKKRHTEVTGVRGYQGEIELMYRAGAVSSVIVEVVRHADRFEFRPGRDERPVHEIDWDAEDRGPLRLVYAYAVMKDGATSKVVVLNRQHIAKARDRSDSADKDWSPWQTDEEAMWLKTAAHRLSKWVPTSAEYRDGLLAGAGVIAASAAAASVRDHTPAPAEDEGPIDGEIVE